MVNSPPSGTKRLILDTSLKMLQERSYNSFSLQVLAKRTNIRKASLYYHFPSKEDLIIKTIKYYREKIEYLTKKLEEYTKDPWERMDNYFRFFSNYVEAGQVCPGMVIGVEFNAVPKTVHIELQVLLDYYIKWLTEQLKYGQNLGEFKLHSSPGEIARLFAATVTGSMILARSYEKKEYFDTTRKMLLKSISPLDEFRETKDLLKIIQI